VLSWLAWKGYFAADPNIVGKTVRVNKHPYQIVGVTLEGLYGADGQDTAGFVDPGQELSPTHYAPGGRGRIPGIGQAPLAKIFGRLLQTGRMAA
jgi:hypothetical protein